jgi:3-dehydroquinate dehydratase-2
MKILVLNGPNINMLGIREPGIYGSQSYAELLKLLSVWADELGVEMEHYQSNHEGCLVDKIQEAWGKFDGIVINPAAYTHTSIAILDALKAVGIPAVEVHISDVSQREDFRQVSYAGKACIKTIMGQGLDGYRQAMAFLAQMQNDE